MLQSPPVCSEHIDIGGDNNGPNLIVTLRAPSPARWEKMRDVSIPLLRSNRRRLIWRELVRGKYQEYHWEHRCYKHWLNTSSFYGCGKLEVLTNIVARCCWISGYYPLSLSVTTIATIYQPGDRERETERDRVHCPNCTGCCRCQCPQAWLLSR